MRYVKASSEKMPFKERIPVRLPDSRDELTGLLLGKYGVEVCGRGMEFVMDDCCISKVEKVVKWLYDSQKRGLLLCGTVGNGKTTMLKALKSLLGHNAIYLEAQGIYDYCRKNQCLPEISSDIVVLIDDLGVEPPAYNDFGAVVYPLAQLLLNRYARNATTVIATNRTIDEIGEIYGVRVKDRMREMFARITYGEPSYRR